MMVEENRMTLLTLKPLETHLEQGDRARRDYENVSRALNGSMPDGLDGVRIVIVGGGIVGLMSAYYAAEAGARVTVLESKALGGAASGRNAGGIYANGRDIGEVALTRVSMDLWADLDQRGLDVRFHRKGHTIVAMNNLELSLLHSAKDIYEQAGLPIEVREGAEAVAELPLINPAIAGGMFSPFDGQGYPFTAVTSLRNEIVRLGGRVESFAAVSKLVEENGRMAGVEVAGSMVESDIVLLAAGPWTAQFGKQVGVDLPVRPRRSQLTVTERLPVSGDFPFVSGNRVYARQTHAENILIGGGGPWESDGYTTSTTPQALDVYGTNMTEMFPGLSRVPIIRAFAGTVELTPDHYPLLGAVPGAPGLWVSAGYNGHGFGLAAAAGRMFAEMLKHDVNDSETPEALTDALVDYAPSRFTHQGGVVA